jgi:spermidine synthase
MKTLYRNRGPVHDLSVTREGGMITLWSAETRHTVFDSAAPHLPGLEYAHNLLAALAFCPHARSCLVLGLGGGSIPRMLLAACPQIQVEAVEIDPAVEAVAAIYFDIRSLTHLTIRLEEAAAFLRHCKSRYGIIVVDTYVGEQFPDQCATREFVKDARKCLLDDGVLAVNWLSDDAQKRKNLLENLELLIGPVWQLSGLKSRNLIYFAAPKATKRPALISAASEIETDVSFENSLMRLAQRLRHAK